jgi:hypothetical protein
MDPYDKSNATLHAYVGLQLVQIPMFASFEGIFFQTMDDLSSIYCQQVSFGLLGLCHVGIYSSVSLYFVSCQALICRLPISWFPLFTVIFSLQNNYDVHALLHFY